MGFRTYGEMAGKGGGGKGLGPLDGHGAQACGRARDGAGELLVGGAGGVRDAEAPHDGQLSGAWMAGAPSVVGGRGTGGAVVAAAATPAARVR